MTFDNWSLGLKSRFRKQNVFPIESLRAPERCAAISQSKPGSLRFTREDYFYIGFGVGIGAYLGFGIWLLEFIRTN